MARGVRARVLVDGEAFFRAVEVVASQARRALYISGWALDPAARVSPGGPTIEVFLRRLVRRNRSLRVFILLWDPAASVGLARDTLPLFTSELRTSPRLELRYDPHVPLGGSQHEKVVVADDTLALVGGIDLTVGRLDGPSHRAVDPARRDARGDDHPPFHDVAVLLEGSMAAHLGERFRARWARCAGRRPTAPPQVPVVFDPWAELRAEHGVALEAVDVGLAHTDRTEEPPRHEIEALFVQQIRAARRTIYIENQYLTSRVVGAALAEQLKRADGAEVIVVGPRQPSGWLEEVTVGLLRWQVIESLRAADGFARLGLYYPMASVALDAPVYVHAKLLIVDDWCVRVGSANLARRSLQLDTETDACLVARTDEARRGVQLLRDGLLAEHLGTSRERVSEAIASCGSVRAAVEQLRGGDRTLLPLDFTPSAAERELALQGDLLFDPEEPLALGGFVDATAGDGSRRRLRDRLPAGFSRVLFLCAAAIAYRAAFPSGGFLEPLAEHAHALSGSVVGGVELAAVLAAVVSLGFPVAVASFGASLVLGAVEGGVVMGVGLLGSALVTYAAGRAMGRDRVRRVVRRHANQLSAQMLRRGALAFFSLRALPITQFAAVGFVAGASRVRLGPYLVGGAVGAALYVGVFVVLGQALAGFVAEPGLGAFVPLVVALAGLWSLLGWISRSLAAPRPRRFARVLPRLASLSPRTAPGDPGD